MMGVREGPIDTHKQIYIHINHNALIHMVAAHTSAHIHRLDSNCPFLSVVETAGLCHVNERGGSEIELSNPLFLQPQIRFGVWLGVYGCWVEKQTVKKNRKWLPR